MIQEFLDYSGKETRLALKNWGRGTTPPRVIRAYAQVKLAALMGARDSDLASGLASWDDPTWEGIKAVLWDIIEGEYQDLFCLDLPQGGAGTSLNMNLNEVVVFLVYKKLGCHLHPLEDINRYQSTNDTFSTAATIVAYEGLSSLESKVIAIQEALVALEKKWNHVVIVGRTELQDALPITLGQVCASWAGPFERDRWRLGRLKERIRLVALGGTALGTGFGAPQSYVFAAERHLRDITGLSLARTSNGVDEVSHVDKFSELASAYRQTSENIVKLCQDLLFYTSGAVGELRHPALQSGSSQMPAKVNPVSLEYATGLAFIAQGHGHSISLGIQGGRLQLNPYLPFILHGLLAMEDALGKALDALSQVCLPGLELVPSRIENHLSKGMAMVNALSPLLGYDGLAKVARELRDHEPQNHQDLVLTLANSLGLDPTWLQEHMDPLAWSLGQTANTTRKIK